MSIIIIAIIAISVYIIIDFLLFFLYKLLRYFNVKEFPKIKTELLDKFATFDPDLGWAPQPDASKIEHNSEKPTRYSTDHLSGRTRINVFPRTAEISTYGDSFCFCREVNDNETWQYYLSNELKLKVSNYGAGNYGIDQALLRLKRQFAIHPTKYVIMAITPWTILRILSVWKHYSEFGNILAVKPRYILEGNNLVLIKNRIRNKEDLLNMKKIADWLRKYDYHYKNFFKKHKLYFPITLYFLKNKSMARKFFFQIVLIIAYYLKINQLVNLFHYKKTEYELHYKKNLFKTQSDLFCKIIEDFVLFSRSKKIIPILIMLPGYEDILFIKKTGNYYKEALNIVTDEFLDLKVIDFYEYLSGLEIRHPESLFTKSKYGWPGHYNPRGNKLIAKVLGKEIRKIFLNENAVRLI